MAVAWYMFVTLNTCDTFVAVCLLISCIICAWNNYKYVNTSLFFKINSLVFMIIMLGLVLLHLAVYFKLIPDVWWLAFTIAVCITYIFAELIDYSGMEL